MIIKFKTPRQMEEKAFQKAKVAKSILFTLDALQNYKTPLTAEQTKELLNLLSVLQASSKVLAMDVLNNYAVIPDEGVVLIENVR